MNGSFELNSFKFAKILKINRSAKQLIKSFLYLD